MNRRGVFLILAPLLAASIAASAPANPTPEQIEFFEKTIRPVFVEHCYSCHSEKAEKLKGGLRLDTTEGLLKGGGTGPAIVPGDPDASLLIKAVRYTDPDLQMPPKNKKLSDEQITSLTAWVKMGAPLPRSAATGPRPLSDINEARARHWAFQPVTKPALPALKKTGWVQTPVDNFVLAKLEEKGLKPAPPADRRTLIRRVTYDLTGLPPTAAEVEAFSKDKRPDAFARVVERLLASPQYGERWGRYWLDVARYADTKGYLAGGEERRYPFSYTYRDYVVRVYNEDKPYNQFLMEQIAADLLSNADFQSAVSPISNRQSFNNENAHRVSTAPQAGSPAIQQIGNLRYGEDGQLAGRDAGAPSERQRSLAALGFLTLGRRFLGNQNDIIDDRIDVVARGTLGLTVACARCHDHKFDPISTKDYYALHGVFASSEEPAEEPLLGTLRETPEYQDYLKEKAKIEAEIPEFRAKEVANFIGKLRHHVGDYLLGARDAARLSEDAKFEIFAGERKLNPAVLRRWMSALDTRSKKPDPIFGPWFELTKLADAGYSTNAGSLMAKFAAAGMANPVVAKALAGSATNSLKAVAEVYNHLFQNMDADWKAALAAAEKETNAARAQPTALPDADREALRQVLYGEGEAVNLPKAEAETILSRRLHEGSAPFRSRIEALSWTHPGAPPRAMAIEDRANPGNSRVLLRGNPLTPGPEVPRRFLEVLSAPGPFTNGSGRLELARAIVSRDNPLTARVYVNRVWLHHFGEGLVNTPGDFGVRTEAPTQRALLDYLAASFVEQGWSTKYLHRLIVLSASYQQSSDARPASVKADPDNRLISRMNRQRLDFEALRDTLLALAGKLDLTLGGLPVNLETEPFPTRRTLYGMIDRQNLPGLFRTFDFANPDTSNQGRFHTTVPQQALFLLNSPFALEQARGVAQRAEVKSAGSPAEKIQALYRVVLQRPATRDEVRLGEKFMAAQPSGAAEAPKVSPLEKYAQILLLSNEVMFVD